MEDLANEYYNLIAESQKIIHKMKWYIHANWTNVKDWSSLDLTIRDNSCEITHIRAEDEVLFEYYMPKNKAETVEVVLDSIDGDMSICINGEWHNWIWDETVIGLFHFIKQQNEISTD